MEPHFYNASTCDCDKRTRYEEFIRQYAALIEGEKDETSVMANTAASLREAFGFFWVGFYRVVSSSELALGPFQGDVACFRIKKGRGVCGTAWQEEQAQLVPDVDAHPGHIACSSKSRSEIVIPIIYNKVVRGVLDIDSDKLDDFDTTDLEYLQRVVRLMADTLYA